jgi:hypothetical protein
LDSLKPSLDSKKKEEHELRARYDKMRNIMEEKRRIVSQIERSLISNENEKYQEPDVASHVIIFLLNIQKINKNINRTRKSPN